MPPEEVYLPHEIARAAGVPLEQVVVATGGPDVYVRHGVAVRIGRRLAGLAAFGLKLPPPLFASFYASSPAGAEHREPLRVARLVQGTLAVLLALGANMLSVPTTAASRSEAAHEPVRLVFIAAPGPGGGGGGGGDRRLEPVRRAARQGQARQGNPVAPTPEPATTDKDVTPQPVEQSAVVAAPIAPITADPVDRPGALDQENGDSAGRAAGSATGTGVGPGIGPGSGGGAGGGVYRPGSGVVPPRLIHEVKPAYPDAARQRGTEGDVVLSLIVRRDGRTDDVRVIRSLGSEFDDGARDAVRRWRFEPGRLQGAPVDVAVEVAVEFRLR